MVVDIEDGTADGHAGNKTANKTTAAVGDTITHSIRLENGAAATADWGEHAKVIDVLPDGVSLCRQCTGEWFGNGQLFVQCHDENNPFHAGCYRSRRTDRS